MRRTKRARQLLAVVGVGAAVGLSNGTIQAAADGIPGSCGPSDECAAQFQQEPVYSNGWYEYMDYTCTAVDVAPQVGEETGVGCLFISMDGTRYTAYDTPLNGPRQSSVWTSGPTSTLQGRMLMLPGQYLLCVGAGRLVNGVSTGITNYRCSEVVQVD
jgi:hypothetical protein